MCRFNLVHNDEKITPPLLEAPMDEEWISLSDNPNGLISCGHYNCYALIVTYQKNVALAHTSSSDGTAEFLKDMIEGVNAKDLNEVSLFLARSFTGYTTSLEADLEHCKSKNEAYDGVTAKVYFDKVDEEYALILKNNFPILKPVFLSMPHDFLVIDPTGTIHLCEEYSAGEIGYERYKKSQNKSQFFDASASSIPTKETDESKKMSEPR